MDWLGIVAMAFLIEPEHDFGSEDFIIWKVSWKIQNI